MDKFRRLQPLLNRVLVRKLEQSEVTRGGIFLGKPQGPSYGIVVSTGPGQYNNKGKLEALQVNIGDKVMLPSYGGQEIELSNAKFFIYRDTDFECVEKI